MASLSQTSAPATPVVSDADAKAWLRVTSSAEDAIISGLVSAATSYVDGADGVLGRALVTQEWTMTLDKFPTSLPLSPVQSVSSITYLDDDGATQTVAASDYRLVKSDDCARIELVDGASWPTPADRGDAVTVVFVAGYGAAEDVPAPIVTSIKLLMAHWYENREASRGGQNATSAAPFGVEVLLQPYRVGRTLV